MSLFTDIDECAVNNAGCEHNCSNDSGGYHCQCASGFRLDQDEHNCTGKGHIMTEYPLLFVNLREDIPTI